MSRPSLQRRVAAAALLLIAALVPLASNAQVPASHAERLLLRERMGTLLDAGRLDKIAADSEVDLDARTRLPDGTWRGHEAYLAVEERLRGRPLDDPLWDRLFAELKRRGAKGAGDVFLHVQILQARAASLLAGERGEAPTPEAGQGTRAALTAARDLLDQRRQVLAASPMWWTQRIAVASELGEPREEQKALFDEGMRRFPDFEPLVRARVRALSPTRGGTEDDVMDLLDSIASMPLAALKEGLYARAVFAAEDQGQLVFLDPRFQRPMWISSTEWALHRWPDTPLRQRYFFMACRKAEQAISRSQLDAMSAPVTDPVLVENAQTLDRCRRFASADAPFPLRLQYRGKTMSVFIHRDGPGISVEP
jgi:hypothetical protein